MGLAEGFTATCFSGRRGRRPMNRGERVASSQPITAQHVLSLIHVHSRHGVPPCVLFSRGETRSRFSIKFWKRPAPRSI